MGGGIYRGDGEGSKCDGDEGDEGEGSQGNENDEGGRVVMIVILGKENYC